MPEPPEDLPPRPSNAALVQARPARPALDPWRPGGFHLEEEAVLGGGVALTAVVFLTNRECPFRCTMCDLFLHALPERTPPGAIPAQIDVALAQAPPAQRIKLYNAGNFFDAQAIPRSDWPAIAQRVRGFRRVIVENHPRLCRDECAQFHELLGTELELALGLETIHPQLLPWLNKQMTLDDFAAAVARARGWGLFVRAFVLLGLPGLSAAESVAWAVRSVAYAFSLGVERCSLIPLRTGAGWFDRLQATGHYRPPALEQLEDALDAALALRGGLVQADLWDVERLAACPRCAPARRARLAALNRTQQPQPRVECACRNV